MLYECVVCKYVFDRPKYFIETHGLDSEPYEIISVCPRCKESGFEEFNEF